MNDILKDLIKQFMPFAQKQIGFERPPRLFLRHDAGNAKNPLGKTAFYDPSAESVTLYVSGRHPKDILRSLGHELVHHKQNCDGEFSDSDDMGPGYAQRDPHLRDMEEKANRDGSMCLRDFEDKLKKENTIYYEHLLKGDNKMSIKDWKNEEIRVILSEAWGFKFNTLEEFEAFDGPGEMQAEAEEEVTEAEETVEEETEVVEETEETVDEAEEITEEDETLEEEEEIEEAAKNMVKGPDGKMVPDYAADGKGSKDLAKGKSKPAEDEDTKKEELQEAIANLLRKHLQG
tara:strand:- start:1666 stop:2532 length:867 start_codon:yes stop_codon:yes gene_type:complete